MSDRQLAMFKRRAFNLAVAVSPFLAALAAVAARLPGWAQVAIGAATALVVVVLKDFQSKADVEAPPVPKG